MRSNIDFKKIKLIIWDLDDTLWSGIIAEGGVKPNKKAFELIRKLNRRGVVSSICSKNDSVQVTEYLNEIGYSDEFVFKSINYESKAPRISGIISNMNLREENVLFVDDNVRNLGEVSYSMPALMISTPEIIDVLDLYINEIGKDDVQLSRLNQYKILEKNGKKFKDKILQKKIVDDKSIYSLVVEE